MAFIKLQFRPGINREVTPYTNEGGWYECDKVRFREGFPEQINGWTRFINTTVSGFARTLHPWVTLAGTKQLAIGTTTNYYIASGGAYYDITPAALAPSTSRIWEQDNYGEDLLFNVRDGNIYYWDASAVNPLLQPGVALSSLPGATATPTIAKQVLVSDRDRHVIAFGCDDEFSIGTQDPLLIRFSDQESLTDWASTPTNTAGSLRLGSGSEIVCAVETRQQTLVFTDTTLYAMQYVGPPFTFGVNSISESITIASPGAAVAVQDQVFWMGENSFYVYNGAVNILPCTLRNDIFSEIVGYNRTHARKIVAGVNSAFSEVWWFYPSQFSTEPDRYIIYNYEQNIWYEGSMRRTAWIDRGIFDYPIAFAWTATATTTNYLYEHEKGLTDGSTTPASAITSYIQSSPIELGDGDQFMFLSRMVPDVYFSDSLIGEPYVELGLKMYDFPSADQIILSNVASYELQRYYKNGSGPGGANSNQIFYRMRGRSVSFALQNTVANVTWRLGSVRIDTRTDGRR